MGVRGDLAGTSLQDLFTYPDRWIAYRQGDSVHERVSAADHDPADRPTWLEHSFLMFKVLDYRQPKPCTHWRCFPKLRP